MNTRIRLSLLLSLGLAPYSSGSGFPSPLIQNVSNAPNPFDSRRPGLEGQTLISYELTAPSLIHITVYDLFGFKVRHWEFSADSEGGKQGLNQVLWDGTNGSGQKVAKGGYLAYLEVENAQGRSKTLRKIGVIH